MSTAWNAYHRRAAALRDLVAELDGDPAADPAWTSERAAAFSDRDDLLVALHELWTRRLLGRVDLRLELDVTDTRETVEQAWREVADELPGVRRVLDRHVDHPALAHLETHEHRMLAVTAGLATLGDSHTRAASIGRGLVVRSRAETPSGATRRPRGWLAARLPGTRRPSVHQGHVG